MAQRRRYKVLYDFAARDDTELSIKTGDVLLVKQRPDGTWPSAEKWMLGTNETTSKHGDFPGGDFVELVIEHKLPKPKPKPARRRTTSLQHFRQTDSHDDSKSELLQSCKLIKTHTWGGGRRHHGITSILQPQSSST